MWLIAIICSIGQWWSSELLFQQNSLVGYWLGEDWQPATWLRTLLFLSSSLAISISGILFNRILADYELIPRSTHLPAAGFILLAALLPNVLGEPFTVLGILMLSIGVFHFIGLQKDIESISELFFTGFFIAIGSFATPGIWPIMLLNLLIVLVLKANPLRPFIMLLVGFAMPYYMVWSGFMLVDQGYSFISSAALDLRPSFNGLVFTLADLLVMAFFFLLTLQSTIKVLASKDYMVLKLRSWYRYLLWYSFFAVLAFFLNGQNAYTLSLAIFPASLGMHFAFGNDKPTFWQKTLFTLLFSLAIIHAFPFFNAMLQWLQQLLN